MWFRNAWPKLARKMESCVSRFEAPALSGRVEFSNGTKSLVLAEDFSRLALRTSARQTRQTRTPAPDWKIRAPSSRLGEPLPGREFPNRAKGGTSRAREPSTSGLRKGRERLGAKILSIASRSGPVRPRKSAPLQRNGHANFRAWSFLFPRPPRFGTNKKIQYGFRSREHLAASSLRFRLQTFGQFCLASMPEFYTFVDD